MHRSKKFWIGLLIINAFIILGYWWNGSVSLFSQGLSGILIAFGRIAGLSAAYTVLLQFMFMGRMVWLEQVFGLDKLSRIHHTSGKLSLVFILLHPLLLITGYGIATQTSWLQQFIIFLTDYEHVFWAFIGFVLFLIVVVSSLYVVRNKLRYESWYFVHLFAYLAVFASFWHQISVGEDILSSNIFYWYWITLYILVFTSHVLFRFVRPIYMFFHHKFEVSRIERENYSTVSVYITGKDLENFAVNPGQFMIFRFLTKGMWWQAHPFSLSMMPNGKELRITVKELGDFTGMIKNLSVHTKIIIDGPYGVFTNLFAVSDKVLLIAGGIGITPIRSLMEEMLKKGKDIVLLYANRTKEDIVFKNEIDKLAEVYNAKVVYILSHEPEYAGEQGYIDLEKIKQYAPDVLDRELYLCGPVPMMSELLDVVKTIGLSHRQVHYEKFSL